MLVYKVFRAEEYADFARSGETAGAPIDLQDGYVHLSTAEQLAETLAKHFAGEAGLTVLALEAEGLSDLTWEPSRGGALFPHLYRKLRAEDVLWAKPLALKSGAHDLAEIL